jgi:hypothetical protein
MRPRLSLSALILAGLALTLLPGCGAGRASVAGKVTYKGKPLAMGTVYFASADGVQWPATISPDGTYRIESMPTGVAKIGVTNPKPQVVTAAMRRAMKQDPASPPPPPPELANWVEIPEKYADPRGSGLSVDLKNGENTHDIDLQ